MKTCIACGAMTSGLDSRPDVVAIGVLVYGAKYKENLNAIRRGLCERHDRIFRDGVADTTHVVVRCRGN